MTTEETLSNRAVGWWNSLSDNERRNFIYQIWTENGQPAQKQKSIREPYKYGLRISGWGDGQRLLRIFPGGYLVFGLYDSGGNKTGVEIAVNSSTTRMEAIEDTKQLYKEKYSSDIPSGYKLIYQEIYG